MRTIRCAPDTVRWPGSASRRSASPRGHIHTHPAPAASPPLCASSVASPLALSSSRSPPLPAMTTTYAPRAARVCLPALNLSQRAYTNAPCACGLAAVSDALCASSAASPMRPRRCIHCLQCGLLDISVSVCGRWRATARYGGPWQGSLPGLAVWGTLHLDGGRTVLEPLGRRDNPPDQRTAPDLP